MTTELWYQAAYAKLYEPYRQLVRFQRGVHYAQNNRLSRIKLQRGQLVSEVSGSAKKPYRVQFKCKPIPEPVAVSVWQNELAKANLATEDLGRLNRDSWNRVIRNVEHELNTRYRLSLVPTSEQVSMHCSCPDDAYPCKHMIALLYTLPSYFAHQPPAVLQMMGIFHVSDTHVASSEHSLPTENQTTNAVRALTAEQTKDARRPVRLWHAAQRGDFFKAKPSLRDVYTEMIANQALVAPSPTSPKLDLVKHVEQAQDMVDDWYEVVFEQYRDEAQDEDRNETRGN